MSERETHDCGNDAAAYLLGALEPEEARAFQAHLAECSICRDEVDSLRGVVQALPMAAPQYPAPRRLRRRVLRAVREEQSTLRSSGAGPAGRRRGSGLRGSSLTRRPVARPALAGALVAACAVIAVLLVTAISGSPSSGRLIRAQVTGVTGSAQLRVAHERAELVVHHLTPPARGHVYEVWLKAAHGKPVPASVLFSVSSAGNAEVGLPRSVRGMSVLMVTSEPDGGSASPTGRPVIVAQLS